MFNTLIGSERAELESKSIQYLRKLADEIGVDSPTLMGKEELIDEIIVVLMGGKSDKKKETRGRPKKTTGVKIFDEKKYENENIVVEYNDVMPKGIGLGVFASGDNKDDNLGASNRLYDEYIDYYENKVKQKSGAQEENSNNYVQNINMDDDFKKHVTASVDTLLEEDFGDIRYGFVHIDNGNYYILSEGLDASCKVKIAYDSLENVSDLREGDEVHYYLDNSGIPVVLMSNGNEIDKIGDRVKFDDLKISYPNEVCQSINLINKVCPISYGSRTIILGDYGVTKFLAERCIKKIASRDKELYIYALCVDLPDEELSLLKANTDVLLNLSSKKDSSEENIKAVVFYNRIKRLVELGNKVFVYIATASELKCLLEKNDSGLTVGDFFSLGASFKDAGSITTMITDKNSSLLDGFEAISTNKIYAVGDLAEEGAINVDANKSETLFTDKFLTIGEIDEMNYLKTNWGKLSDSEMKPLINKYE